MECDYCAVRTEFSLISLTCEVCAFDLINLGEICGGRIASGEGVDNFPLSLSFHQYSILILIYMLFFQKDDRTKAANALISDTFSEIEEYWIASSFNF